MKQANTAAIFFLIGSILFTIDGIIYLINDFNFHYILYTIGSLFFAIGSSLMII